MIETWAKNKEYSTLNEATPPAFSYAQKPQLSSRGDGVAVIYRDSYLFKPVPCGEFSSFESLIFYINKHQPVLFILLYPPPKLNSIFIPEFSDLLSLLLPNYDQVCIIGDFNIHICCPGDALAGEFLNL